MKLIGPEGFEFKYRKLEVRVHTYFANQSFPGAALCATLGLLGLNWWAGLRLPDFHYFNTGGFRLMSAIQYRLPWAVLVSVLFLYVPAPRRALFQFLTVAVIWVLGEATLVSYPLDSWSFVLLSCLMPCLCLTSWAFLKWRTRIRRQWLACVFFFIAFWTPVGVIIYWFAADEKIINGLWRLKLELLWITIMVFAFNQKPSGDGALIALNPVNALHGVLWPAGCRAVESREEKRQLWWSGMTKLYFSYFLFLLRMALERGPYQSLNSVMLRAAMFFYLYLIGDVAGWNAVTGLAHIFGLRAPDATQFAVLSRTPAEYWRRIAPYNYQFVFRFIKLPMLRVLKNDSISTAIAFLFFFLNHFGAWYLISGPILSSTSLFNVSLWLSWLILILVTRRWWFFSRRARQTPIFGWASIIITNVICTLDVAVITWLYANHYMNI